MSLFGENGRILTKHEAILIRNVFKTTALPPLTQIRIRDGESPTGTAITIPLDDLYNIMVGKKLFYLDLADKDPSTLVHEMTHVWQYFQGTLSRAHALSAHAHRWAAGKLSKGYRGTNYLYEYDILTDSWNDMGFEGQAQLVEEWFSDGMGDEAKDKRFCFVKKVLYDKNVAARKLNIIDLCDEDFYGPPGPDPEPIRVTSKDDSFVIILNGDVLFDFDKSDIKPAAVKVLDVAAKTIKSVWRDGSVVLVNGYTDNVGCDDYNLRLSERRAQAVAHWFPSRGLPYSVMRPRGFGKKNPVAPNTGQADRAKNRRVEVFVWRS
jgi:outer membrane protein OmpA-like peptidoglycan-associated protein